MTCTETTIRKRVDGSIDTEFYMSRGRLARAKQADHLARTAMSAFRRRRQGWRAALFRLTPRLTRAFN